MNAHAAPDQVEALRLAFREGMSQLAAAVNIVTTDGPGGMSGFTASAVCSVTDQPPTLLVCLNRSSSVANIFERNRVLCVNTLSHSQEVLSRRFGGSTSQEERFLEGEWSRGITGSPRLEGRSCPSIAKSKRWSRAARIRSCFAVSSNSCRDQTRTLWFISAAVTTRSADASGGAETRAAIIRIFVCSAVKRRANNFHADAF